MFSANEFQDLVQDVISASDVAALQGHINGLKQSYGLTNVSYVGDRSPSFRVNKSVLLTTYSRAWAQLYVEKNYHLLDPVHQLATTEAMPFDWSNIVRNDRQTKAFFGQSVEYGVGTQGISFPLRGPQGQRGVFTITTDATQSEWNKLKYVYLRDFHAIAQLVHEKVFELASPRQRGGLSEREHQCITALASGESPQSIAFKLGITESAVRLYISKAKRKLGVRTLSHLIATAVENGLLTNLDKPALKTSLSEKF